MADVFIIENCVWLKRLYDSIRRKDNAERDDAVARSARDRTQGSADGAQVWFASSREVGQAKLLNLAESIQGELSRPIP